MYVGCVFSLLLRDDATLMSGDMYRELRRQKWEEQEAKLANLEGDTHYEDIRFDGELDFGIDMLWMLVPIHGLSQ